MEACLLRIRQSTVADQVSSTTTINAIAVASGYGNSSETSGTYTISAGSGGPTVNLSGFFNVYGIWTAGSSPANGGFDSDGYGYTASLIGNSVTYQGVTFPLGSANRRPMRSARSGCRCRQELTANSSARSGRQRTAVEPNRYLTYTDGTVSTFTQSSATGVTIELHGRNVGLTDIGLRYSGRRKSIWHHQRLRIYIQLLREIAAYVTVPPQP